MMIKKPYHLAALAVALSTTSNFDNFASALDDHGRGLRGNAMANGSVNIDLKGRKPSIDVDGNHHHQQQRNLKKKHPATTGRPMEELEEVQADEVNEVEWQEVEVLDESLVGQLEEELGEVQAKEDNEVEWQEGEVLDEPVVGQLEEELGEVQKEEKVVEWQEGEVLDESLSLLDESLVEQLEEELEEVEWEEVQEESLVEQLEEELEEVEWEDEEKEVQLEEGEDTDESLVEQLADDLGLEDEVQLEDEILTEETPGFFVVGVVDFRGEDSGPEKTFNIMLEDSTVYEIEEADEDWMNNEGKELTSGQAVTIPAGVVLGKSGKVKMNGTKLQPSEDDQGQGKKKKKKKNDGRKDDSPFGRQLKARTEELQHDFDRLHRNLSSARTLGEKKVVVVRVVASDAAYSNSEDWLRSKVFGKNANGSNSGDRFNLSSGYEQCSYGKLTFTPKETTTGQGVSINNGVVTINVNIPVRGKQDMAVVNTVTDKINQLFGRMTDVAHHWMYCLPPGTYHQKSGGGYNYDWGAWAYLNNHLSVYNDKWCDYVSGQMHEIGHNIGYDHSNEGTEEYGDDTGIMGKSYYLDEGPAMCFNAAKSWQSGWYGGNGLKGDKTLMMRFGDSCFSGRLSGIADYGTTGNKVLVKIVNPSRRGDDIFVAFNAKKGINSGTRDAVNQVTVVQVTGGGGTSESESKLLRKMNAGGSYINYNFGGKQLSVQVGSVSVSGSEYYADVKIYFGSSCTGAPPPPSPTPPTPAPAPTPSLDLMGPYEIGQSLPGGAENDYRCIDLRGGNASNGNQVGYYPCNQTPAQSWYWDDSNNYIRSSIDKNKCLVGSGGSSASGTKLMIWDCFNNDNRFRWDWDANDDSLRPRNNNAVCIKARDGISYDLILDDCNDEWKSFHWWKISGRQRLLSKPNPKDQGTI